MVYCNHLPVIDMLIFGVYNPDGPNEVRLLGGILPVAPSVKYMNHRVDSFAWGYGGAGPSQFAFALLLHFCGAEAAFLYHDAFKWDVLVHTDSKKDLFLNSEDVQTYVAMKKAQQTKLGILYWKFAAKRKFSYLFYLKFILPLELKVRQPIFIFSPQSYYLKSILERWNNPIVF